MWWEGSVSCGRQQGKSIYSSLMAMIKTWSIPYQTSFPPHPSCFPFSSPSSSSLKLSSHPIRAKGSCGDSSCMAEERVIKRRRPKEEVKGPGELLPPKRTHRVLGTRNFSQGGSVWCFSQAWTCSALCVFFITSSQTNDDPLHTVIIRHESI